LQQPPAAQERDHCYECDNAPALLHIFLRSRRIAVTVH
jgi:hypothetical protein